MNKREFLSGAAALPVLSTLSFAHLAAHKPAWPNPAQWDALRRAVGGRLAAVASPLDVCSSDATACAVAVENLKNPFFIRDQAGATQISGWTDAWMSRPSAYAVAAADANDIAAAVDFARRHNVPLAVKGGGHSYVGGSNAADSLLVWTRAMDDIRIEPEFTGRGWPKDRAPVPAVSVGAGCVWMDVYDAVTTKAGRYVQGGGCATVGVAGLVQGGGFGSFSKRYGLAAAGLLEAEIVTADGKIRVANAFEDSDLFWALKGGAGGTFGVVTRLTLATHELPKTFGDISVKIKAANDTAFRNLVYAFVAFYAERLFNPHWGESVNIRRGNVLEVNLVFQDVEKAEATSLWKSFLDMVTGPDVSLASDFFIETMPAQKWWDVDYLQTFSKGSVYVDPRPGAPKSHAWWQGDDEQVGAFIHAYKSAWLPQRLLEPANRAALADALFAASRYWSVSLHFNKGLAGAPPDAVAAARECSINPAVADAFALAIVASSGRPDYTGDVAHDRDADVAANAAAGVPTAIAELRKLAPHTGSYVSEGDYHEEDWQRSFWGANYPRLLAVKKRYDPHGLFRIHHGVGSEI